jgi:hypothetical protein
MATNEEIPNIYLHPSYVSRVVNPYPETYAKRNPNVMQTSLTLTIDPLSGKGEISDKYDTSAQPDTATAKPTTNLPHKITSYD